MARPGRSDDQLGTHIDMRAQMHHAERRILEVRVTTIDEAEPHDGSSARHAVVVPPVPMGPAPATDHAALIPC